MKTSLRRGACALLALLMLCSFVACTPTADSGEGDDAYILTSPSPGRYVCEETGTTYLTQPFTYLPAGLMTRPYAVYDRGGSRDVFYRISDESAPKYLVLADEESYYPYYFIAAEGQPLPSLIEMDPTEVWICNAEAEIFWASGNIYDKMRLGERVNLVVAAYRDGEVCSLPTNKTLQVCVQLIFRSETFPELYYYCTYYAYGEGECYLYEFGTGRCVRVSDDLFEGYVLSPGNGT